MPFFEYKAMTEAGAAVTEVMEASNPEAVAERLEKLGYLPIHIKAKGGSSKSLELFSQANNLKPAEVIIFTKQLVTLLKAGVPLLSSLEALNEQADSEALKEIISKIYVDIESGLSFSESLKNHPKSFSDMYVHSIRAGEMGGALDEVLVRIAQLMEHDLETMARVKAAFRYPVMVVISLILAFITLIIFVVPKFIALFETLGVDLPLPTVMLIFFYRALTDYWYIMIAVFGLTIGGFIKYIKTEKGAFMWDLFKIRAPVFGNLNLKTAMSRFTRMFETLNSSGLPILQTLEIAAKTVGNRVVAREIEKASQGILQGQGIATPLGQGKVFPPMVVKMIAIGEQSGSLDEMLRSVSEHYDTEVDYAVKGLTSMIEPMLTVGVGVIVLFLALAIFMPMWDLTKIAR